MSLKEIIILSVSKGGKTRAIIWEMRNTYKVLEDTYSYSGNQKSYFSWLAMFGRMYERDLYHIVSFIWLWTRITRIEESIR